jgi:thiamine phosphate synthase YjbQ (UPF0047 family)
MYTTYHLSSAQDVSTDILDAIKIAFKSKAISITIREKNDYDISEDIKKILDERLIEDESDYISSDESIRQLKMKYGV